MRLTRLAAVRRALSAGVLAAVLAAAVADCGGGSTGGKPAAGSATGSTAVATRGSDGIARITIAANDNYTFVPATVQMSPGPIEVTVRNVGKVPHNLVARGVPGAAVDFLDGGQSATLRFTLAQPGSVPFVCTYHERMGMTGAFVVR